MSEYQLHMLGDMQNDYNTLFVLRALSGNLNQIWYAYHKWCLIYGLLNF